jgi:hypothetical protein
MKRPILSSSLFAILIMFLGLAMLDGAWGQVEERGWEGPGEARVSTGTTITEVPGERIVSLEGRRPSSSRADAEEVAVEVAVEVAEVRERGSTDHRSRGSSRRIEKSFRPKRRDQTAEQERRTCRCSPSATIRSVHPADGLSVESPFTYSSKTHLGCQGTDARKSCKFLIKHVIKNSDGDLEELAVKKITVTGGKGYDYNYNFTTSLGEGRHLLRVEVVREEGGERGGSGDPVAVSTTTFRVLPDGSE